MRSMMKLMMRSIAILVLLENMENSVNSCSAPGKTMLSSGLSDLSKRYILDTHNRLRQRVALGQVQGQPPAANMRELVWDEELAASAQRWADQCRYGHDRRRQTSRFSLGQNIASSSHLNSLYAPSGEPDFSDVIGRWFNEVYSPGFPSSSVGTFRSSGGTGHYSQIVWADTYLVGCGYVFNRGHGGDFNKFYVCNYGPAGNVIGQSMYVPGQSSCFSQGLRTSRSYAGLCEAP